MHPSGTRVVYERDLRAQLLAHVLTLNQLRLADLRDPALTAAGIDRAALVSSPSEHYPCTRRVARAVHGPAPGTLAVQGMLWHSRQTELHDGPPTEVMVVFTSRYASRGEWVRSADAQPPSRV